MNWMPEPSRDNLQLLALAWVIGYFVLLFGMWRSKRSLGLPLGYIFVLSTIHASGAFIYCFEYYLPREASLVHGGSSLLNTYLGFWQALVGLWSFIFGCWAASFLFRRMPTPRDMRGMPEQITTKLPGTLLLIGIIIFMFMPLLGRIPSFSSFSSAGSYITVIAVMFFAYNAHAKGERSTLFKWMLATGAFPFVTIVTMGFANYGINAASITWQLILRFLRPRWLGVLLLVSLCYGGLSFYVVYMRQRDSIRASVWSNRSYSDRLEKFKNLLTNPEPFNPYNQAHMETIDIRLNQNDLVGKAVLYLSSGQVGYAHGGTFAAAILAVVPRILWPGKPSIGGSGTLVSRFTGQKFADGTSIGIGQVMEFYVNWGTNSVIAGFFILGMMLRWIDMRAANHFHAGDYWAAARWLLPGLVTIQPGGIMAEIVGAVAGAIAFTWFLNAYMFRRYYEIGNRNRMPSTEVRRGSRYAT